MGARVSLASTNLFVHAPLIRKSKNGLRGNTALCPRAPGLRAARRSLASPHEWTHPKRIPAHQTRSRQLSKRSVTSGCSERSPTSLVLASLTYSTSAAMICSPSDPFASAAQSPKLEDPSGRGSCPETPSGSRRLAQIYGSGVCGKLRKPTATGVEDARMEDSPSGRPYRRRFRWRFSEARCE